jgi:hypothetical protein
LIKSCGTEIKEEPISNYPEHATSENDVAAEKAAVEEDYRKVPVEEVSKKGSINLSFVLHTLKLV